MDQNLQNKSSNTVWHESSISRAHREQKNGHRAVILWFTGLSGAGKSTLAHSVEEHLNLSGSNTYVLDGDNVRQGLCGDLSFTKSDREENIRRIGEVSKLFMDAGVITLNAFISPFKSDRQRVRDLVGSGDFIEVFCRASLEVCEQRDVKGLYSKARKGEIQNFTGISSPYEAPENAELTVDTGTRTINECAMDVLDYLHQQGVLPFLKTRPN